MRTMTFSLYDTAAGGVRPVELRDPGRVSLYVCGPTVYDYPHVGHGRAVLTYDILRRWLESVGYKVHHVSNITDIEDKIIVRSKELGIAASDLTEKYEAEWYRAMDALDALRPHDNPHATAYVEEMIALITTLIENGSAYETSTSVYFSPERVADYGLLSRQTIESLRVGARVEHDEEKRSPIDFALWKKHKPSADEPTWDSPWGPGRPGWHTECVVMSLGLLGEGFDLHTGGLDLAFPHHENERAQAVASGMEFARHWMHNGFIEVDGEKMSKSLGNFTSLTQLIEECDPRGYRLLLLRAHYRSPMEVTRETLSDAENALRRLDDFARRFAAAFVDGGEVDSELVAKFDERLRDDLDTPSAMAFVFQAVRQASRLYDEGDVARAEELGRAVKKTCDSVGLFLRADAALDEATARLVAERDTARAEKNWARADELRNALQDAGWTVEDSSEGTRVHR